MVDLLQQGVTSAWFFIPTALLLGALHGLEPGHSKTLMAAFIVAVRGTAAQAVLLGVAATVSHTLIVWAVALGGMLVFQNVDAEAVEPYFQVASGVLIIAIAAWMAWRTYSDRRAVALVDGRDTPERGHGHGRAHGDHSHTHDEPGVRTVDTGHGVLALALKGVPGASLHWTVRALTGHGWNHPAVSLETTRPDGRKQRFAFVDAGGYLQSVETIAAPLDFTASLRLGHGDHTHAYSFQYQTEEIGHDHAGMDVRDAGFDDAHARAHAEEIRQRFSTNQNVTTGQIILFGLTGGLIPCPAAITVLVLCLQLQEIWLGALLVLCFSIGLAGTLVGVGVAAAIGARTAAKRFPWLNNVASRAPYVSTLLIGAVGLYVIANGSLALTNPVH